MENGGRPAAEKAFTTLMNELFRGPAPQGGMFLNEDSGVFSTLEGIDSDTASEEVRGSTVAAHAGHLLLYLEVLLGYLKGEIRMTDWEVGWKKKTVDEEEWDKIRSGIRDTFESIEENAKESVIWDADRTTMTMSLAVHSAYHLGAIRQIVKHF